MNLASITVFEFANITAGEPVYDLRFLSESGGPVRSSAGIVIDTEKFGDQAFDTLIVVGGNEIVPSTPGLIARLLK